MLNWKKSSAAAAEQLRRFLLFLCPPWRRPQQNQGQKNLSSLGEKQPQEGGPGSLLVFPFGPPRLNSRCRRGNMARRTVFSGREAASRRRSRIPPVFSADGGSRGPRS